MQPDIEIYIKENSLEKIEEWLKTLFGNVQQIKSGKKLNLFRCEHQSIPFNVEVLSEAVGKHFTCLWFQSANTPWKTDLDCAKEAFSFFHTEIRCSEGGWTEGEAIPEQQLWWRVNANGEDKVIWN